MQAEARKPLIRDLVDGVYIQNLGFLPTLRFKDSVVKMLPHIQNYSKCYSLVHIFIFSFNLLKDLVKMLMKIEGVMLYEYNIYLISIIYFQLG